MAKYRIIEPLRSSTDRIRPVAKLHLLIPKGYRLLGSNANTQAGDFFWFAAYSRWEPITRIGDVVYESITIRPLIKRKRKAATVVKVDSDSVPKPPRGYRLLKKGTEIREGDKYWSDRYVGWRPSSMIGCYVGNNYYCRKK